MDGPESSRRLIYCGAEDTYGEHLSDESSFDFLTKDEGKLLLGGKAYGLYEMQQLGIRVPDFAVFTTEAWKTYKHAGDIISPEAVSSLYSCIRTFSKQDIFGDEENPLFLSVRSGAPVSMPGAMETILNVGLTSKTLPALIRKIGEEGTLEARLVLLRSLAIHAYGIDEKQVERVCRIPTDDVEGYPSRIDGIRAAIDTLMELGGASFRYETEDPNYQLIRALTAVFRSWDSPVANSVRKQRNIPYEIGTAATVQRMVFGNSNRGDAGSGVMFTCDPYLFSQEPVLVYAPHAQGNKVVDEGSNQRHTLLSEIPLSPAIQDEFAITSRILEYAFGWPQEIEYTIDGDGVLWILQHRDVRLSDVAQFRYLRQKIFEGELGESDAIRRMPVERLQRILSPGLEPADVNAAIHEGRFIGAGIPMTTGNATGIRVTTLDQARSKKKIRCVFVPDMLNIQQMTESLQTKNVVAVVAPNGGAASHVGRIASLANIPCVFGVRVGDEHRIITVDATTGNVFPGKIRRSRKTGNGSLLPAEIREAKRWLFHWRNSPWDLFADSERSSYWQEEAKKLWQAARQDFVSSKAQENVLLNLFPEQSHIQYIPMKVDPAAIDVLVQAFLRRGNDVTIRTCHNPPKEAKAPYFTVTDQARSEHFFQEVLPDWQRDGNLTEVIVGAIPKGKLDASLQPYHCSWTMYPDASGSIRIQLHPTAYLRAHEAADPEEFITVLLKQRPDHSLAIVSKTIGTRVTDALAVDGFADFLISQLMKWWVDFEIPTRLAAISAVINKDRPIYPLTLEGQSRIATNTDEGWIYMYGMKVDPKKSIIPIN